MCECLRVRCCLIFIFHIHSSWYIFVQHHVYALLMCLRFFLQPECICAFSSPLLHVIFTAFFYFIFCFYFYCVLVCEHGKCACVRYTWIIWCVCVCVLAVWLNCMYLNWFRFCTRFPLDTVARLNSHHRFNFLFCFVSCVCLYSTFIQLIRLKARVSLTRVPNIVLL